MPRLAVVRDRFLNPWDASNYYGVVEHRVELLLCGTTRGPDWDTIAAACPKARCVRCDSPWDVFDYEPDVIDVPDPFYSFSAYFSARFHRTVVVGWETLPGKTMATHGALKCIQDAWKFAARSELAKMILEMDGAPEERIAVIPGAVNTNIFTPGPEMLGKRECAVLFVGRDAPEKGLADLICAMRGLDAELWVAGQSGNEWYRDLAKQYGVTVRWFGPVPWLELPALYQRAAVFCLPSIPLVSDRDPYANWTEQFGQVLIEAMACRTPIVATDCGAIGQVVNGAGVAVPPRDIRQLRLSLEAALRREDLWAHWCNIGQRTIRERYEQKVVGERICDWYFGGKR